MENKGFITAFILVFPLVLIGIGQGKDVLKSRSRIEEDLVTVINNKDRAKLTCTCYPSNKCPSRRDYCETYHGCYKALVLEKGGKERTELGCMYKELDTRIICQIKDHHNVAVRCCSNGTRCNGDLTPARLPSPGPRLEIQDGGATVDIGIFIALPFIGIIGVLALGVLCVFRNIRKTCVNGNRGICENEDIIRICENGYVRGICEDLRKICEIGNVREIYV